jgi:predicted DNA-binding transcriptional regulator YafY
MRADRLLSLLMLLQTRGPLTAQRLAEELEVSERTIYRDITALSTAGVPIYANRGPGGGCALLEDYRTNLTGLRLEEVRALFMLSIPAPLDQLGVGQELRAALLKLSAALPASRRPEEERSRQRIYLDSSWWFQTDEAVPHLQTLQQALWCDRKLRIIYRSNFEAGIEQSIDPYGLVAKASVWYLVYVREKLVRAIRVSKITEAEILDETFIRLADFDLAAFWKSWCAEFEENRPTFPVTARISPALLPHLPRIFGNRIQPALARAASPDAEGWVTLVLPFETFEAARNQILTLGRAVEILAPEALRLSVVDYATQIVDFYNHSTHDKGIPT